MVKTLLLNKQTSFQKENKNSNNLKNKSKYIKKTNNRQVQIRHSNKLKQQNEEFIKEDIEKVKKYQLIMQQLIRNNRSDRIILIRHGESEANIDENLYSRKPDNKMQLTQKGLEQAEQCGQRLKKIFSDGHRIKFYVSPYQRTRQTCHQILQSFQNFEYVYMEDPRLREQEFGNYQTAVEEDKKKIYLSRQDIGKFYYRFPSGESGSDVYDRCSLFFEKLFRNMDNINNQKYDDIVIVTHGLFMRMFIMKYFNLYPESLDNFKNPRNCEIWILQKNDQGNYDLIMQSDQIYENKKPIVIKHGDILKIRELISQTQMNVKSDKINIEEYVLQKIKEDFYKDLEIADVKNIYNLIKDPFQINQQFQINQPKNQKDNHETNGVSFTSQEKLEMSNHAITNQRKKFTSQLSYFIFE